MGGEAELGQCQVDGFGYEPGQQVVDAGWSIGAKVEEEALCFARGEAGTVCLDYLPPMQLNVALQPC